jgi:hypothetical protein
MLYIITKLPLLSPSYWIDHLLFAIEDSNDFLKHLEFLITNPFSNSKINLAQAENIKNIIEKNSIKLSDP